MNTITKGITGRLTASLQNCSATARRLLLAALCSLLLIGSSLAQEQRPEQRPSPGQASPEATATQKAPDPNEAITPGPLANDIVDGDIIFTSPGQFPYPRDIRLSDNFGGLRFYGANSLTTSPAGAAIQFFGNNAAPFNGQLYLDSGALDSAALIFRTAPTGGTITERMRIGADGRVGIGATDLGFATLRVVSNGSLDGVVGVTPVAGGFGVHGVSNAGSDSIGVRGESSNGTGVVGETNAASGFGVFGRNNATTLFGGVGVRGVSDNGTGVSGFSDSGNGVLGQSITGFAGRFLGAVTILGNLTKSSGSFKIDHPLDPANKYLSHSFVESPDMMNIYNGIVTLDARGRATVTMPPYFEALNREFRYQLTALGSPGPGLHVADEIKGNRFRIAGGRAGMKVSWQVTGVRRDAYAEAHRIKVEEDKPIEERGTYLHPEAFGQPKEKSAGRAPTQSARGR